MQTVLLTLGRLPKALALARACRALGCRVIVAEPFRWHLCRPSRAVDLCVRVTAPNVDREAYFAELLALVEREKVDLVLPVSEEALHVAALGPRLPPGVRLFGADHATLARLHDKLAFARLATELGLPMPETHPAGSPAALALSRRANYIEKPRHSCSGIGLRQAAAGEPLQGASGEVLVQEFLEGEVLSSLSLVEQGREIATVVYRGTVFAGTVAVCFERVDAAPAVRHWISSFLEGCPCSGLLGFDFIVDTQGEARALECNPRATSGVHFFDAASLGRALLAPAEAEGVAFAEGQRFQWAYSTLTEAYAAFLRPREFTRRMGQLFSARDVVWESGDPLPFLLMTPLSWEILWPAMSSSLTLGEATQRDIAWFGEATS
jgi:predicted ATP-grasp superfamily ATP-dependent carboligase